MTDFTLGEYMKKEEGQQEKPAAQEGQSDAAQKAAPSEPPVVGQPPLWDAFKAVKDMVKGRFGGTTSPKATEPARQRSASDTNLGASVTTTASTTTPSAGSHPTTTQETPKTWHLHLGSYSLHVPVPNWRSRAVSHDTGAHDHHDDIKGAIEGGESQKSLPSTAGGGAGEGAAAAGAAGAGEAGHQSHLHMPHFDMHLIGKKWAPAVLSPEMDESFDVHKKHSREDKH